MWVQAVFGANAEIPNSYRFSEGTSTDPSWTLVVTAPDGTNTTESLGVVSSSTSDYDYYYIPTTAGTYMLTFNFPATTITSTNDPTSALIGDTYTAATASTNLTVQSTAIAAIPQTPLPTAFWTRPIYGENSAWYSIASNWLSGPGYAPQGIGAEAFGPTTNVGSLTPHIMWTMPLTAGGVVGQTFTTIPGNTYGDGSAYDQKFTNPIIVDGMLIFTEPISQTEPSSGPTVCYNLETGKELWSNSSMPQVSFAYVYDAEDPNQHGVWPPMLVVTPSSFFGMSAPGTWTFYDAYTGDQLFTVNNVPAFSVTMLGPEGEFLGLNLANLGPTTTVSTPFGPVSIPTGPPQWYLQEWNSSRLWDDYYSGPSTTPTIPPPITDGTWTGGYVTEMTMFGPEVEYLPSLYDFNVSLPWLDTATINSAPITSITAEAGIQGDILLAYGGTLPSGFGATGTTETENPYEWFGIGLNATSGTLGSELWSNTVQPPSGQLTVEWGGIDPVANVFVTSYLQTAQYTGYSLATGKQIWGPTAQQVALDYYGGTGFTTISTAIGYGCTYSAAYGGIVYCYNDSTGNLIWTYGNGGAGNSTNAGVETPFGDYPTFVEGIGSGVVYTITTEHTPETPIFKGALARAINATTGQQIWTISDYTGEFGAGSYCMADGYNVMFNSYDNSIQVVGRGPSHTTVTAPGSGVTTATPVVISGTVTDISSGTTQTEQAADFPNGVPCASDASMTQWMGYVYDQQPEPTNFIGVPVTLSVTDSNGNHYNIGTATTNPNGFYSLAWTPTIPGNFTVTATFAGTQAYYGSSANAAFYASAPAATAAPTASPVTGLASTATLELGVVAIIIVIVIIGVVLALLMMRKHP
jgi:hypothetical protein